MLLFDISEFEIIGRKEVKIVKKRQCRKVFSALLRGYSGSLIAKSSSFSVIAYILIHSKLFESSIFLNRSYFGGVMLNISRNHAV